ncbi:MAG: DAK2 domain-containing protein [Clostridia bacterium]|nr:DAK2 domain-containing protein [Clostridia bacterium]
MIQKIDGLCFKNMVDYGVRNLNKNCKTINQLNVFPVPDGDTGTNMLTTISKGLVSVDSSLTDLSSVSKKFAKSIVFEARGNSGVIVSQFLKGFSETLGECDEADSALLIAALEKGVICAYSAVANPVEGTMLTVVKDATNAVKKLYNENQSIDDTINLFIQYAKISLDNTPNLLATLKDAGVVDSGGAGIVCLFEGMKKYLDGDNIEISETTQETTLTDYSLFNKDSVFEFGYCTEMLIQLLNSKAFFDYEEFKKQLDELGSSVVTTFDSDKVRVHIHTCTPSDVLSYCQQFGEFLTLKIENMTVQHTDLVKNILCSPEKNDGAFAIVAVAFDRAIQNLFIEMGADAVIYSEDGVSTKDYIDAFKKTDAEEIIVFPNGNDAILSAMQAKNLYKNANIHVINSKDIAECYAALPIIDFESTDIQSVVDGIDETIKNLYVVSFIKRKPENENVEQAFYALHRKEILGIGSVLDETVFETVKKTLETLNKDIVTIFYGESIPEEFIENIVSRIENSGFCVDVYTIPTQTLPSLLTISFE